MWNGALETDGLVPDLVISPPSDKSPKETLIGVRKDLHIVLSSVINFRGETHGLVLMLLNICIYACAISKFYDGGATGVYVWT